MNGVDSHVTNCDNMFLKYDNSINIINQMTTNTTANCVEAKEVKESASTLSNNFYYKFNTKSKLKSIELTEHDERSSY